MKNHLVAGLIILVIVSFFVGQLTAPQKEDPRDKIEIDQLKRDKDLAFDLLNQATESIRVHKAKADQYLQRALDAEKSKSTNKTVYENTVRRIDTYTADELDSALLARYPDSLYRKAPERP